MKSSFIVVRNCLLFALLMGASGVYASELWLSRSHQAYQDQFGYICNAGQWPDSIVGLYQAGHADVWFTRTGMIRDSFGIAAERRFGTVTYTAFQGLQLSHIAGDAEVTPVTYINGALDAAITAAGYLSSIVTCVFTNGTAVQYTISKNGILAQHNTDSTQYRSPEHTRSVPVEKEQEDVQGKRSSVFINGSYFGGPGIDEISVMETLPDGSVLIAGSTTQAMFPESLGGYSRVLGGNSDGFLARVDGLFRKIYRWTFLGGSGVDKIRAIAFDRFRNICVVSQTDSYDMPVLVAGSTSRSSGGNEAHIAMLDSTMSKLTLGLYHGGLSDDVPCCISVDAFDDIVIAGTTTSTSGLPTSRPNLESISGFFISNGKKTTYSFQVASGKYSSGKSDGFLATYSNLGQLRAARYYGSEGFDTITAMTTDKRGRIVFAGTTSSQNLTTVPIVFNGWPGRIPYLRSYAGGHLDGFVVRINRNLQLTQEETDGNLVTYFGGIGTDRISAIDLGRDEDIFLVGNTTSNGFYRSTSIQSSVVDKTDGYVAWLRNDGSTLDGFTYWGGSADDEVLAVRADTTGTRVTFGGRTFSDDFPVIGAGSVSAFGGESDGFLASIDFQRARYSTLAGGEGHDELVAFTDGKYCDAVFALNTASTTLPASDSALIRSQIGPGGYISRYSLGEVTLATPKDGDIVCSGASVNITWQASGLADTIRYFLEYRRRDASDWISIAKGLRAKSYQWTVPRSIAPGAYTVRVTTQFGHASETIQPITIDINPSVTIRSSPPRDCEGASVRMVAVPANVLPTFQWRRNGVPLIGAADSVFVITSLDTSNVGLYDCVVGGRCSQNDTSNALEVGVTLRPIIRSQPSSMVVNSGQRIRLGVSVDGAGMSYQWYRDSIKITNATNSEFIVEKASLADSGRYWCTVTNVCGSTVSGIAVVDVRLGTSVIERDSESSYLRLVSSQPVRDELRLECRAPAGPINVCLTDLMGRSLISPPVALSTAGESQIIALPVSHIEPGLLVVVIQFQDRALSLPVLIVR